MASTWRTAKAKADARKAASEGLLDAAEYLLENANRTVPIEESTLQRSGSTAVDRDKLEAQLGYDTPYAVRQHEELGYRHAPGRRAKWLELTLTEEQNAVRDILADALKKAHR